ncbi:hypothetical protein [Nocardioides yefusunii]|uniref:Uncharacterized protein n=1 Tax=Nocardioides yefusunii TaxID=2500546 RepID=A0ABW1QYF5_9ACTN|nr:hypothetical protein [Nocardioides yefusunii]
MKPITQAAHLTHDELSHPAEMVADARRVASSLDLERAARAAVQEAPSIHFADFPSELPKREITVTAATAALANSLHLHLD